MRPKERRDSGQSDFFRARLDQIVDMGHPLELAATIDWRFLEERFGAVYSDQPGHPPLPTRLMAGLSILKHTHNLSDEELCARWVENPYFQLFCGEEFFVHKAPFDRSSLTRWRQRMGEEKLVALIQESLSAATRTGAAKPSDFSKVDRRHHRAAEGGGVSDRRKTHAPGARAAGAARPEARRALAPVLRAGGQAGADGLPALRPRQAVQARQPGPAQRADLFGSSFPRHRAQNQGRCGLAHDLRRAAVAGLPGAPPAPEPARTKGLFAARARGRMHRQGQGPSPLRDPMGSG